MTGLMLIAVAAAFRDWAIEQGENKGQVVEAMLKRVGLGGGYPWCAAAVHLWGEAACWNPVTSKSSWPLPATAGCAVLGEFAEKKKILKTTPQVGDVFLIWHESLKRFGHTGVVTHVNADGTYLTLEGNTNNTHSREGYGVFALKRTVRPKDRFIRWTELLPPTPPETA